MTILVRLPISLLADHPSAKFTWDDEGGHPHEGFVIRFDDDYRAYENSCPHLGTPLDWGDNQFFEESARHLVCSTHGALFRPGDGHCIGGPCAGDELPRLRVDIEDEFLVVSLPGPS